MKVTYVYRAKGISYSLERVFSQIRKSLPDEVQQAEFYCKYNSHNNPLTYLRNTLDVRRCQSDIYHITGAVNYVAMGLPKGRTVITVHDIGSGYNYSGFKINLIREIFYKRPFNRVNNLTAISQYTKDMIVKKVGIDPKKITVIYDPLPEEFSAVKKEFNTDQPRILCFGHMQNKNLLRHIQALRGINCHLRIIGKLPEAELNALRENDINYSNAYNLSDEQIVKEYVDCDMLLFASLHEGFGVPILEAQLTGRPIVSSTETALKEVVMDSVEVVDAYDVSSIRAGILRVLGSEDLRAQIVEKGFDNTKRFNASLIADSYKSLYDGMLSKC